MAIGIADIKSLVMQIIVLMSRHKGIDTVRRSIAVVILWLDLMLFITVIRVYLLPNKCELVKEEEESKRKAPIMKNSCNTSPNSSNDEEAPEMLAQVAL